MADLPAGRQALRSKNMYYAYVLITNCESFFYKGLTNDIERRLKQHLSGQVGTTRSKLPVKLIFVQICQDRTEARKLEKYLKSGFGREIIREIAEQIGPVAEWQTLRS